MATPPAPWANFQALSTSPPAPSAPPAYLLEEHTVHDFTQDLRAGFITIHPAIIHDPVRTHDLPPRQQRMLWQLGKKADIYSRQLGKEDECLNTLSVDGIRAMSFVFDDAVTQSGLVSNQVNKFVYPVVNEDQSAALATVLMWMNAIMHSDTCYITEFKRIDKLPVYRYYRLAQIFRGMGVDRTRKTMVKRIENMSYKGQWYRPEIEDVELITEHIRSGNGIRQGIVESITNAWLDRMLGGNEEIEALMSKDKTFEAEVNVAVENASEERCGHVSTI